MIKALYAAGKILSEIDEYKDYYRPWANPFPKAEGAKVIVAEINEGKLEVKLKLEDFKKSMVDKYLFREAPSRSTNLVPTFYLQVHSDHDKQADSIRKLIEKIEHSISNYQHTFVNKADISKIHQMLLDFPLMRGTRYLFTMRIDGKYFGDFEEFSNLFLGSAYDMYNKKSKAANKICSVTYERVSEVWGRVSTLGFTVDDISFSRNGFNDADSYKMFPVSPNAVKILEGTKRLVFERLSQDFYKMNYVVLPRLICGVTKEASESILQAFLDNCSSSASSLQSQFGSLIYKEDIIGEILKNEHLRQQGVYYDIFFYKKNQAQFMIKLHVSDVLPSRFKKIMETKASVEQKYKLIEDNIPVGKGQYEPFQITFANIKDYFAEYSQTAGWLFQPYFFKLIEAVFYGTPLNYDRLLGAFMDSIRKAFKNIKENPNGFSRQVRHSFVILQFFQQLNLIPKTFMTNTNFHRVGLTLDSFEQQHPDVFSEPIRKAAFYLGCATEKLLEKQRSHLRSEPFRNNLNSLHLDLAQLRKVHLRLMDKVSQYNLAGHFYPVERAYIENLDARIAETILQNDSPLSKTDISYAFAAGMAMQKEFTKEQIRLNQQKKNEEIVNSEL